MISAWVCAWTTSPFEIFWGILISQGSHHSSFINSGQWLNFRQGKVIIQAPHWDFCPISHHKRTPSAFFRFSTCWHCTTSTPLESYLHALQVLSTLVGIEQRHARDGQPFLQVQQKPYVEVEKVFVGFALDLQVCAFVNWLNDFKANEL